MGLSQVRLLWLLAAAFLLLVALQLHGFSLAAWHDSIDGSDAPEVLLGSPRPIRSDEWAVQLPMVLAQRHHDPAFPLVNSNIGLGQNMLAPIPVPVAHPVSLFRPTLWGFFLGADVGLAWMWWCRALGLLAVWFAVFHVVTRGRVGLSLAGSAFLLASPFLQFWSLNAAPLVTATGLGFLCCVGLLTARRPGAVVAWGLGLGWAGGCFLVALYPPYQVVLGYLGLTLLAGFCWDRRHEIDWRAQLGARGLGLALAVVLIAAAATFFLWGASDVFEALRHTAYPGRRIATGGDRPFWQLLNSNLFLALQTRDYGPLLNVCEAASFWLFSPVLGAALGIGWLTRNERPDGFCLVLLALCGVLNLYCVVGFPELLARATLLSFAPAPRAVLALGVADVVLLVRFLALGPARVPALALAGLWGLGLGGAAWQLGSELPHLRPFPLAVAVLVNTILAWAILTRRWPGATLGLLVAALCLSTLGFNPLARGGSAYLHENPLSRKILEIDAAAGGRSAWVTYGSPKLPNLIWSLGVQSLNGTHTVPQEALWQRLDPEQRQRAVYNRYAHFDFRPGSRGQAVFRLLTQDSVYVLLDPDPRRLRAFGATHLLVHTEDPAAFQKRSGLPLLHSQGSHHIFAVPEPGS